MPPLLIQCECGHLVEGQDEPALIIAAHQHIAAQHPDLVGCLSDEDLRQMARRQ